MNPNQRESRESFEEYRYRLRNQAADLKEYLEGRVVWNSQKRGPYVYHAAGMRTANRAKGDRGHL